MMRQSLSMRFPHENCRSHGQLLDFPHCHQSVTRQYFNILCIVSDQPSREDRSCAAVVGVSTLIGGAQAQEACPKLGVNELTGAGATFPFPLYSKMLDEYNKLCGVKVNYQSIGSGGGIRQIQEM